MDFFFYVFPASDFIDSPFFFFQVFRNKKEGWFF